MVGMTQHNMHGVALRFLVRNTFVTHYQNLLEGFHIIPEMVYAVLFGITQVNYVTLLVHNNFLPGSYVH